MKHSLSYDYYSEYLIIFHKVLTEMSSVEIKKHEKYAEDRRNHFLYLERRAILSTRIIQLKLVFHFLSAAFLLSHKIGNIQQISVSSMPCRRLSGR